jgi:ribulose-phosphate 3-epimerase
MPGRDVIEQLGSGPVILPSLLLCDFANLQREVEQLQEAGIRGLHLDVMDGQFVPNLTYGMPIVDALRKATEMPLDVHLMIDQPKRYLQAFANAGADLLTVHIEACEDIASTLSEIRSLGMAAGVALNPSTDIAQIEPALAVADLVLVMSVPAGFGGQPFEPLALEKTRQLRSRDDGNWVLEMDGGINTDTIASCSAAGADWLVIGSAIFGQSSYSSAIEKLLTLASH